MYLTVLYWLTKFNMLVTPVYMFSTALWDVPIKTFVQNYAKLRCKVHVESFLRVPFWPGHPPFIRRMLFLCTPASAV